MIRLVIYTSPQPVSAAELINIYIAEYGLICYARWKARVHRVILGDMSDLFRQNDRLYPWDVYSVSLVR